MSARGLLAAIAALLIAAGANAHPVTQPASPVNIVLVHGAFIDGSSWRGVYDVLTRDGYRVSVVQEPLTGFDDDVAATKRVIDQQNGQGGTANATTSVVRLKQ